MRVEGCSREQLLVDEGSMVAELEAAKSCGAALGS